MTIPHILPQAAAGAVEAAAVYQDPARQRPAARPQLRRYNVATLLDNGSIAETRHTGPALPLFENAFCAFSRGSLIETPHGPVAVEDLLPGDEIATAGGGSQTLIWIGRTTLVPGLMPGRAESRIGAGLTSFMADSLGLNRPSASMVAGPAARLLRTPPHLRAQAGTAPLLSPAADFRDGMNIFETAPPAPVELYHLCLPRHAVISVGGLEFESYHPGPDALKLVSYPIKTLFLNMFSHASSIADFGPLACARADAAPYVPEALAV
ncbi:Hint domain-containing protein [Cribrihabitans neustonicus]|uniref:Hint domain-containing protein n=1 Tax=Cribrihabitans neustonicus TaxID=1429085 RepID=UPI003B5AF5FE